MMEQVYGQDPHLGNVKKYREYSVQISVNIILMKNGYL